MPGTNLTREEAATRSALVVVDRHDVELDLTTSERTFATTSTIRFRCARPGEETFLDFVGESVDALTVNGVDLDPATHYADSRVRLPDLAAENVVTVAATGRFTNTGEGLHRFVDPVDDEVYLYSQFEVPDSRRMYPVFEQPDLKASFAFTVTAPAHWQVVSNAPTPEPEPAPAGSATWRFAPTQRISSYVTALVAGPYDVVRDSVTTRAGEVPLGLFCRKSLRPYLDADNLFDLTKRGFAFFEAEFDQPYPFEKYDQLFSPEYNMGAMENAGCVTISEIYVFRSRVTEALVERRALTVLHELAHMWFGDLVTMRWWNDLWLNESFAEWASTTAQAEATEWVDAWTTFGTYEKDWAYTQDELSTTHPIVAEIRDLEDVEVNFDGITYAKGASVLKQLVAYVGREAFRDGLRAYFARHAWGNTTLDDLLTELERTSGRDLRTWSALWLETWGQPPAPGRRGRRVRPDHQRDHRADPRNPAAPPAGARPLRGPRPGAGARRPHRARRRRRAHRGATARRPRPARPAPRQRRRPHLRQAAPRPAVAGHRAHPRPRLHALAAAGPGPRLRLGHDARGRDGCALLRRPRPRRAAR